MPGSDGPNELERDRALIDRIRAGDTGAFDGFIQEQWKPLVYFVSQSVGNVDDAEDLAQEVFFRIWSRRRGLRPEARLRAYLFQIARNLVIDHFRKRRVRDRWARDRARATTEVDPTPETLELLTREELLAAVEAAIARLPPRRREAFTLVHTHGFSYRDAASIMGIAPQTLADQVSAALGQLRRWLVGGALLIL